VDTKLFLPRILTYVGSLIISLLELPVLWLGFASMLWWTPWWARGGLPPTMFAMSYLLIGGWKSLEPRPDGGSIEYFPWLDDIKEFSYNGLSD